MVVRTVSNSLIGQTLGHYKILDQLGAGGMGVVYRAQDTKLGRQVALKVLPTGNTASDEAVERFRREARTASALNHPNICTIYGFDEHEGQLYLAMELLDGEPLDRRLSGRPLDLRQHARHRRAGRRRARRGARRRHPASRHQAGEHLPDAPRPGEGARLRPREAVAGIPRRSGRSSTRGTRRASPEHFTSMAGTTVGTIAYMSPEQARGDDVDPRTDLFSFGVVLYEMATGRQSFPGHTTAVVFDGILNRDPAPPSTHQRDAAARARSHHLEGAREGSQPALSDGRRHARRSEAAAPRFGIAAGSCRRRRRCALRRCAATVVIARHARRSRRAVRHRQRADVASANAAACRARSVRGDSQPPRRRRGSGAPASAVVAIAAIAAGVGAYFASRGGRPPHRPISRPRRRHQRRRLPPPPAAAPTQPASRTPAAPHAPPPTAAAAAAAPPATKRRLRGRRQHARSPRRPRPRSDRRRSRPPAKAAHRRPLPTRRVARLGSRRSGSTWRRPSSRTT